MHIHKSGFGLYVGRRQTRQQGVLEFARDTTTGRQKSRKARMLLVDALEHARHGVRDIVDTRAGQPMLTQYGHSLVEIAAPVFAVGGRAAHLGDETTEQRGKRFACPGIRHRAPNTVDTVQREGPWREVMGMGLTGQDGQHLARTQAHTEVEPPEKAVGTGCLAQGEALESAGRFDPDDAESPDPIDDGVRARCFLDAKNPRAETQDTRDSAKADTRHAKELQGQEDHLHLGQGDKLLRWVLELTQTRLGRFEGLGGAVALSGEASDLLALGAMLVASLRGFVLPLISTVCDFGALAHHVCSCQPPWPEAMGVVWGCDADDRRGESDGLCDAPLKRAREMTPAPPPPQKALL